MTSPRHEKPWVIITTRVPYGHVDAMSHVYYGNYLLYFEMARNEWMRVGGMTYREFEELDLWIPVAEAHVKYHGRVLYDDEIEIRAALRVEGRTRMKFYYEIRRVGEEALLTTGWSQHVVTDRDGHPRRIPSQLTELLERVGQLDSPPEGHSAR